MKQSLVKRYGIMTPEERRKVYASHKNGMTGRTHTDATKRKISEINKGNSYAKGFKRTPEQRARLSEVGLHKGQARVILSMEIRRIRPRLKRDFRKR